MTDTKQIRALWCWLVVDDHGREHIARGEILPGLGPQPLILPTREVADTARPAASRYLAMIGSGTLVLRRYEAAGDELQFLDRQEG